MYTLADFIQDWKEEGLTVETKPLPFERVEVQRSSVQEVPVTDAVGLHEIILTTGYSGDKNPDVFREMIDTANKAGAAAVLYTFDDPNRHVPKDAVDYASDLGLPILLMPWEVRFAHIQESIIDHVRSSELGAFREVLNDLFQMFAEGKSISDAADYLAEKFYCSIEIRDSAGVLIAPKNSVNVPIREDGCVKIPIRMGEIEYGNLLLADAGGKGTAGEALKNQFRESENGIVYIASPLALWFNKKNIEDLMEIRLKNDFVRRLSEGNYDSLEEMVEQGSRLGLTPGRLYGGVAMRLMPRKETDAVSVSFETQVKKSAEIEQVILEIGAKYGYFLLSSKNGGEFLFLLEHDSGSQDEKLDFFLEEADRQIGKILPGYHGFWGIGKLHMKFGQFQEEAANARAALEYCEGLGTNRFRYRDTLNMAILTSLRDNENVQRHMKELFGELIHYDESSRADLLLTLTEYIRSNYNISQTSRNMNIHRQTLLYRLEKIEELTGMSLRNHEDLFLMEVFVRMRILY